MDHLRHINVYRGLAYTNCYPVVPGPLPGNGNWSCSWPFCKHAGLAQKLTRRYAEQQHLMLYHCPFGVAATSLGPQWQGVAEALGNFASEVNSTGILMLKGQQQNATALEMRQHVELLLEQRYGIRLGADDWPTSKDEAQRLMVRMERIDQALLDNGLRASADRRGALETLEIALRDSSDDEDIKQEDVKVVKREKGEGRLPIAKADNAEEDPLAGRIVDLETEMDQVIENLEGELKELRGKLLEKEEGLLRLEEMMVQRDQQVKELQAAKEEAAKMASNIIPERDYFKNALGHAHSDVVHSEQELSILREGLEQHHVEIAELHSAREFAEAETEKLAQDAELAELKESHSAALEGIAELQQQLESAQQDLVDALAREARQEESSRGLLSAQKELEVAYDEAVAQLEEWKREQEMESGAETEEEGENGSIEEEDEGDEESMGAGDEDLDSTMIHNSTMDEYVVIDLQAELNSPPPPRSSKSKLPRLLRRRTKSSKPSRRAVKLFAVKELEDDLRDYRGCLKRLCAEVAETDSVGKLQRLQTQVDEIMHLLQLTATKLEAVRSFSD